MLIVVAKFLRTAQSKVGSPELRLGVSVSAPACHHVLASVLAKARPEPLRHCLNIKFRTVLFLWTPDQSVRGIQVPWLILRIRFRRVLTLRNTIWHRLAPLRTFRQTHFQFRLGGCQTFRSGCLQRTCHRKWQNSSLLPQPRSPLTNQFSQLSQFSKLNQLS